MLFQRLLPAGLILLLLHAAHAGEPGRKIVFGGDANYPPFEWLQHGTPTGFTIDLENEFCASEGLTAGHRLTDWPAAIEGLRNGTVDVLPMFNSEHRRREFTLSTPFFYVSHALYAAPGAKAVASISEVGDARLAVEEFSYAHEKLGNNVRPYKVITARDSLDALRVAASGQADYALIAVPTATLLIRRHNLPLKRIGPEFWPREYAFAVRKDRPELAAWIESRLKESITNGVYEKVYRNWYRYLDATPERGFFDKYGLPLAGGLALIAFLTLAWVYSLRRLVGHRTRSLERELVLRREAEEKALHLATHDSLTDLPATTEFLKTAQQQLKRFPEESSLALVLFNLEDHEHIFTSFGYETAEGILLKIAARVRQSGVLAYGHITRSTFAILTERNKCKDAISRIGVKIPDGDYQLESNIICGVAYNHAGITAHQFLINAEIALSVALRQHDPWVVFDSSMRPNPEDLAIVSEFRTLKDDALYCLYQPQIDLATGRIVAVETLARWSSPRFNALTPDRFIPLLENSGLVSHLTKFVIRKSIALVDRLRQEGIDCRVAINLSANDFHSFDITDYLVNAAGGRAGTMSALKMEITETEIMSSPKSVISELEKLKSVGVSASIDDFGVGYSSLFYLANLPIDEVKLDKSFIQSMLQDTTNYKIVQAVISLAHQLGFTVIAEGVETEAQLKKLREFNCDKIQGYLISRPLEEEKLRVLLRRSGDIDLTAGSDTEKFFRSVD